MHLFSGLPGPAGLLSEEQLAHEIGGASRPLLQKTKGSKKHPDSAVGFVRTVNENMGC